MTNQSTETFMVIAYLDPGAGSLAVQMLIAAAVAVPFFLRIQIGRVVARLRRLLRDRLNEDPASGR